MQDLMQEQIPVPIKEWSRASVKAQIQINTTKKNVRMHILQTVDKALLLQGFAIVGTAFLI